MILFGATGQLGQELLRVFPQAKPYDRSRADFHDPEQIAGIIRDERPRTVINAAAETRVDWCEDHQAEATLVNGTAVEAAANAARQVGARFIHFSTDYVFDGRKPSYLEDDEPAPINAYGRSKLLGEQAVLAAGGLVLRTSWVYASTGKNFYTTMKRLMTEGEAPVRVVDDQLGVPNPTWWLAEQVPLLAAERGLYHLSCTGQTTWHGFAEAIAQRLGAPCPVAIPTAEYPTPAKRPACSVLDSSKAHALGIPRTHWRDAFSATP